jgi:hypothetical protein
MKNLLKSKWKITASLVLMALLIFAGSASATLTVTLNNETGALNTWPFTPSWVVNTNTSLIAGLVPTTTAGNFSLEVTGRDVNTLSVNTNLTIAILQPSTSCSSNYVTCGNGGGAGSLIVYTLPASANGYNLTNITVYGGWANNGRDAQAYTVLYSTVADPSSFNYLTTVNYNPAVPGSTASANREIISDTAGGVIAANVAAVKFVFNVPNVENGFVGYAAITVGGTVAGSVASPVISVTTSNESGVNPYTPTWTPESPSLISGLAPSSATGNFTAESSGGTNVLTDGIMGQSGNVSYFATCGNGRTLIYTLTNVVNGSDVTNIVLYSGWGNADRDGQYFTLSYSSVAAPTTYIPITTVFYNPITAGGASANRVAIKMNNGTPLASAVANLKFDFSPASAGQFDNGYQGYSEIIVQGNDTTAPPPPPSPFLVRDTLPARAETFVGDQVVFTAVYSNAPPANVQWQYINAGGTVTNDIVGATAETLTLNNVQLTNTGSYRLKAVNATNGAAAPSYSALAPLVVSTSATVGNVVTKNTGQTGPYPFYPAWTIDTNSDLVFGLGSSGAGAGNFTLEPQLNPDPAILSDGALSNERALMVSCGWVNVGAGQSMTYTLPAGPSFGYEITNITVYGGWPDDGRNQQKYQILYSTFSAPSTFVSIGTFDYNPTFNDGAPNSTRVILVPLTGVLAHNVAAVQINFNLQSKNNWNGYSEITIGGTPSLGVIPILTQDITPLTAEDVVGSQLTITGAFSDATSYQWQKNGTNLVGQTTPTLTLSNLQPGDTATNGGYRLLGINAAGTNTTRGCSVVVDPTPSATNNVITAFAFQTSDSSALNPFSPTWDTSTLGGSLIAGQNPPSVGFGPGNFNDPDVNFPNSAGGLPILTDGGYGTFAYDGSHPAFAAAGPSAGQYVVYALGAAANGYNITNIQISGGWNDNGRDSQYYTILYSTVANTNVFLPLTSVTKNLSGYGANDSTTIRTTLTPATGVLASNVYAIEIDFQFPAGVPNGYSGYSEISVFGSPSAAPPTAGPVITTEHEEINNIWTVEAPNLIANLLPSSQGPGVFTQEGCNVTNLTDGVLGFGFQYGASCGGDGTSVPWIIFSSATGWDLTNIVVYTLWHDYGRDGQFYNVSYSTLSAPTTFLPLASVAYNPFVPHDGTDSGNRVNIAPPMNQSVLASNVAAVKFDFTPQGGQDFGWSGYAEIVLQGTNLASTVAVPPTLAAPYVSGGNLILTGTGGTPGASYTWLTTTNLSTPIANWTTNTTGALNGSGGLSNSIPVDITQPTRFFRLRMP